MAALDRDARREAIRRYHSLFQIPGLEGLVEVCRRNQVTMTCHGGAARRIAATIMASATDDNPAVDAPRWSIFDCLAYNSDLDLVHSGQPEATPGILNDIYGLVPFAEHIRWELRSRAEQEEFDAAKTYAPIIPLCLISLGTHGGWNDPWNGLDDLAEGTARFIRNGFYRESPRFERGVDIELLQVLLYYKVLVEIPELERAEGLGAAAQVIVETGHDYPSLIRLQDSSYLRLRLRYFLSAIKGLGGAALAPDSALFDAFQLGEIETILVGLGGERELRDLLFWNPRQGGHLSVTSHLGGDVYRLPSTHADSWGTGDSALGALKARMSSLKVDARDGAFLADDQQIVMASPELDCAPGIAPSTQDNEFLHFAGARPGGGASAFDRSRRSVRRSRCSRTDSRRWSTDCVPQIGPRCRYVDRPLQRRTDPQHPFC